MAETEFPRTQANPQKGVWSDLTRCACNANYVELGRAPLHGPHQALCTRALCARHCVSSAQTGLLRCSKGCKGSHTRWERGRECIQQKGQAEYTDASQGKDCRDLQALIWLLPSLWGNQELVCGWCPLSNCVCV